MTRKDFLKKVSFRLIAAPAFISACGAPKFITNEEDCKLTDQDDLGPFFVKNTPEVVNLNTKNATEL